MGSSEEGSSLDEPSWVSWFCMLRNHEFFCEVDPAFVQDRFNLYGLKEIVGPLYGEAMTMILGYAPTEKQLSDPTQRIHKVLETARILYGLIHARYVLTAQGLTDMVRRLALCWLCTRAHARALSCRLVRSLHVSLR